MKKLLLVLWTIALVTSANAQVPALTGRVNDYAKILTQSQIAEINTKLQQLEAKGDKQPQIVILTTPDLNGQAIEQYSIEVAKEWKIGHKEKNNGILIVIAPKERRARIEVGYGLEGNIPDSVASSAIDKMKPLLKKGNEKWDQAIIASIDFLSGRFDEPEVKENATSNSRGIAALFLLLGGIAFVIGGIVVLFRNLKAKSQAKYSQAKYRPYPDYGHYPPTGMAPDTNKSIYDPINKRTAPKKSRDSDFATGAIMGSSLSSSSKSSDSSSSDSWSSSSDSWSSGGGDFGGGGASGDF